MGPALDDDDDDDEPMDSDVQLAPSGESKYNYSNSASCMSIHDDH